MNEYWPASVDRLAMLTAAAGTRSETTVRALLHRIDELEREVCGRTRLSKAAVEEAASSLFITDAGLECQKLLLKHEENLGFSGQLTLTDVTALLCKHLGVPDA